MGFNIQATIGADGSGFFREMSKVERSQAALDAKIAARNFEKLDHAGKLNALKQQEMALSNRAFQLDAAGDKSGAARATLAALEARERRERMITEEKLRQQKIQDDTATKAARDAETARRAAEQAAREQQRLAERAADQAAQAAREKQRLDERANEQARRAAEERARQSEREMERLNRIRQQDARFQRETADKLDRYRQQRVREGLRRGPAVATTVPVSVRQIGRDLSTGALGSLTGFGAGLGAAAAAGAAVMAFKGALNFADQVTDTAEQMGVTTSEFQRLELAAGRAGLGIGDFQQALSQIDVQRREAGEGNEELRAQFARFGVTLADINNPALRHLDILKKIAAQTGNVDAAGRAAMKQLLGRRGDRLGGALSELAGVGDNEIVSEGAVARLDNLNKKAEQVGHTIKNWGIEALASWDSAAEGAARFVYSFFDARAQRTTNTGNSREDIARRSHLLDENAGLTDETMTGESKVYSDFIKAQVTNIQQGGSGKIDFATFAAAREKNEQATLFTNKENKKLEQDIAEIVAKRGMIGLTNAEKEVKIKKDIADAELEIMWAEDATARLRLQKALEEKRNQLAEMEAKDAEPKDAKDVRGGSRFESQQNTDSLSKKGLFIGAGPAGVTVAPLTGQQATREFTRMVQTMERLIAVNESGHNRTAAAVTQSL